MFNIVKKEIEWGGRTLTLETGRIARQANGAVLASYGETSVLCTATAAKEAKEGIDFFPLTVNYQEKTYAAGKIPGGFFKREGRLSEKETLTSRLIDRPIRPMFPENYKNETQIICTVLSYDKENDADILALIGASAALEISEVPFLGPIAGIKVGYNDSGFILNPTIQELPESQLDLTIAGSEDSVLMVESEAHELSEEKMLEAVKFGLDNIQPVIKLLKDFVKEAGKEKWEVAETDYSKTYKALEKKYAKAFNDAYNIKQKQERYSTVGELKQKIKEENLVETEESSNAAELDKVISSLEKDLVRAKVLAGGRIDGRKLDEVRPITSEVNIFPRTHGSALFTRGETQSLGVVTLGSDDDEQMIDSLDGVSKEGFMFHYNFPPYSVGEVGMLRAPGRREIGHGKLAKKAVEYVVPSKEEFPYTIRVVSEITESNGSSSMASVCSSSLALMHAGVPIKQPVSGIAMGLVKEGDKYAVLSDIMGDEDHLGDMDFKVAGTKDGVTALQMDIKIKGLTFAIFEEALKQANAGRLHILGEMAKTLETANQNLNDSAPVMTSLKIKEKYIREVIGQGGKVIKKICEDSGAKISIEDSGEVKICAPDKASADIALGEINDIVAEPEIGQTYEGTVQKITDYGAFVGFMKNASGLIHISEFSDERLNSVADYFAEGDVLNFKVVGRDGDKLRLSYKAINDELPKKKAGAKSSSKPKSAPANDSRKNGGNRSGGKKPHHNNNNKSRKPARDEQSKDDGVDKPKKKKKGFFW